MKRAFEVKEKTFFPVSQVFSVRHKKQTSKNLVDTTFKVMYWITLKELNHLTHHFFVFI